MLVNEGKGQVTRSKAMEHFESQDKEFVLNEECAGGVSAGT